MWERQTREDVIKAAAPKSKVLMSLNLYGKCSVPREGKMTVCLNAGSMIPPFPTSIKSMLYKIVSTKD